MNRINYNYKLHHANHPNYTDLHGLGQIELF
jgi:hypothetical protein